jgi:hypothetical protein
MAAGDATLTTSAAILKTKYTQPKVYWLAYMKNPAYATIRKDETFGGDSKVIAVQTETPQGGGVDIPTAQTNLNPGIYKRFTITRISDYGVARIQGQALKAAEGNENALLTLWKREMDGILHTVKRSAAIHLFRNGLGARGQISAGSNTGTATITLARVSDITNFAVGLKITVSATDGGATRAGGTQNPATIVALSRTAGTITLSGNWSTLITGAAPSDFIQRNGDNANTGPALMLTGMQGWCPQTDPTATLFFGLDRSSDTVRLGGLRLDCSNTPIQEAAIEAIAMAEVEGAEIDYIWLHPRDRATLVKELGAKVIYTKVTTAIKGSSANIGFDAIEVEFDGQKVKLMSDINVQRGTMWPTQWDTWTLESLGPAPQIMDFDSNQFLRTSNDDSYEVRVGYWGQPSNMAPAYTVNCFNVGQ